MPAIARISTTPVRTFALSHPERLTLGPRGVVENRRFLLVDGDGRRLPSSTTSWPIVLRAEYDAARERLAILFPDGDVVEESALGGEELRVRMSRQVIATRVVPGAWEPRLAALAGHPVRIARCEVGEALVEPVTLVSDGSLQRLSREAGRAVDGRRFRMLFELSGCDAHEEDGWAGRRLRAGEALLRVGGPVERCAMTTRHPDTGERDLDTLGLIAAYRGRPREGKIDFGVYAQVEQPGVVRVGDPVELL